MKTTFLKTVAACAAAALPVGLASGGALAAINLVQSHRA